MKTYKITVLGDVMSEGPLLQGVRRPDGSYDYDPVFLPLKGLMDEADNRIVNLETPVAGEDLGYTDNIISFNAPRSLVTALQKIGVDAVSTANTHAVDRGATGLVRTLDTLDELGLAHTGTYRKGEKERIHYFTLGDTRLAMIASTYEVNAWSTFETNTGSGGGDEADLDQINFLFEPGLDRGIYNAPKAFRDAMALAEEFTGKGLSWEERLRIKATLGLPVPYRDDNTCDESVLHARDEVLRADFEEAKKHADVVLFLPHTGGQFNVEPGHVSEVVADTAVKLGADAVLAAHSHTTQKAAWLGGCPTFYSLGNVSMSSNTFYSQHQTLPMYGLAAHLYVSGGKINDAGYSVFKIVEKPGEPGSMRVVPVDELYASLTGAEEKTALEKDVEAVVRRVSGASLTGAAAIRREYRL